MVLLATTKTLVPDEPGGNEGEVELEEIVLELTGHGDRT